MEHKGISNSIGFYIIIILITTIAFVVKDGWKSNTFYGDALGYYAYLPSVVIDHNLTNIEDVLEKKSISPKVHEAMLNWEKDYTINNENHVILQYTYGIALLESPGFLVSHLVAKFSNYEPDGYSMPYNIGIKLTSLLFTFLGIYLLFIVLRHYVSIKSLGIALTSIYIGSNVLWFAVVQAGMAHNYLFFLYAFIIYGSFKFYSEGHRKLWVYLTALALGLLVVIRPTDIIAILIPFFYGVTDKEILSQRFRKIKELGFLTFIFAALIFFLPILPQFFYWKMMTGNFIYYSYGNQGFNWFDPNILKGLFGEKNGWFLYSPLLLIPVVLTYNRKIKHPLFWVNMILLPIYIYVVYAWWNYYYINGFGSRPMIHIYPLLAFPLAFYLERCKGINRSFIILLITILSIYNMRLVQKGIEGRLFTDDGKYTFLLQSLFHDGLTMEDLIVHDTGIKQDLDREYKLLKLLDGTNKDDFPDYFDENRNAWFSSSEREFGPIKIEYTLTKKGKDLQGLLDQMAAFSMKHYPKEIFKDGKQRNYKKVFKKSVTLNSLAKFSLIKASLSSLLPLKPSSTTSGFFLIPVFLT